MRIFLALFLLSVFACATPTDHEGDDLNECTNGADDDADGDFDCNDEDCEDSPDCDDEEIEGSSDPEDSGAAA